MKGKWFIISSVLIMLLVTGKTMGSEAKACLDRGNAYLNKGQYDLAMADFNKAIEIDPKFAKAYNNRGDAYEKKGQYDLAIADFTKAIEVDPKFAFGYAFRGFAYGHKGQYDQAIADYVRAIVVAKLVGAHYKKEGN
jgi:tetratricopeptide (TPR) repeat protein